MEVRERKMNLEMNWLYDLLGMGRMLGQTKEGRLLISTPNAQKTITDWKKEIKNKCNSMSRHEKKVNIKKGILIWEIPNSNTNAKWVSRE